MQLIKQTCAAKKISAYIILKGGKYIAKVHFYIGNSGTVKCDVYHFTLSYQGKASGYGYDKKNAAIAGAFIDGNRIYDDGHTDERLQRIYEGYLMTLDNVQDIHQLHIDMEKELEKIGARFANWDGKKYGCILYVSGLARLTDLGYQVLQAI